MNNFSHSIDQVGFNIHLLENNQSPCANIYFHGFTAITSKNDLELLRQSIPIVDNQDSILVHWDSGDIKNSAIQSIKNVIENFTPAKDTSWKTKIISFTQIALKKTTDDAVNNFEFIEKKSESLGSNLSYILDKCESSHQYEHINLIGHSLGARLVLQGVCSLPDDFKSKIKNVILMGGAIGWQQEFGPPLERIRNLHLFNLYSSKDHTLIGKPGFEHCIGRSIIPESPHYQVTNIHCTGFGHTDYWPKFIHLNETHKFLDINPNA